MNLPSYLPDNDGAQSNSEGIKNWVRELTDFTPQHVDEVVSQIQSQRLHTPIL